MSPEIIHSAPSQFPDTAFLLSTSPWKFDVEITNRPIATPEYLPVAKGARRLWKVYRAHILLSEPANRIMVDGVVWHRSHRQGVDYFETAPRVKKLKAPSGTVKWEGPEADKFQWTEEPWMR